MQYTFQETKVGDVPVVVSGVANDHGIGSLDSFTLNPSNGTIGSETSVSSAGRSPLNMCSDWNCKNPDTAFVQPLTRWKVNQTPPDIIVPLAGVYKFPPTLMVSEYFRVIGSDGKPRGQEVLIDDYYPRYPSNGGMRRFLGVDHIGDNFLVFMGSIMDPFSNGLPFGPPPIYPYLVRGFVFKAVNADGVTGSARSIDFPYSTTDSFEESSRLYSNAQSGGFDLLFAADRVNLTTHKVEPEFRFAKVNLNGSGFAWTDGVLTTGRLTTDHHAAFAGSTWYSFCLAGDAGSTSSSPRAPHLAQISANHTSINWTKISDFPLLNNPQMRILASGNYLYLAYAGENPAKGASELYLATFDAVSGAKLSAGKVFEKAGRIFDYLSMMRGANGEIAVSFSDQPMTVPSPIPANFVTPTAYLSRFSANGALIGSVLETFHEASGSNFSKAPLTSCNWYADRYSCLVHVEIGDGTNVNHVSIKPN